MFKGDEAARADFTQKLLTLFYGTPAITGIYLWGFDNKLHWRKKRLGEHCGLFDDDLKPNPAGLAYFGKINHEWTTVGTIKADNQGILRFRGFPGRYQIKSIKNTSLQLIN